TVLYVAAPSLAGCVKRRLASKAPSSLRAMMVEPSWLASLPTRIVVQGIWFSFSMYICFELRAASLSPHSGFLATGNRRKSSFFVRIRRIYHSTDEVLFPAPGRFWF